MSSDKYLFHKQRQKEGDERDTYYLVSPDDFEEFIYRIRNGKASEEEHDEFTLHVLQHYCDSVYQNAVPEPWVLEYLANQFNNVLQGGRWEDEFPLPWTKVSLPYTRAEWIGLEIACDIENFHRADPNANITDIIKSVAADHHVSYENARGSYYKWRVTFSK